jgi:hypothetical protein
LLARRHADPIRALEDFLLGRERILAAERAAGRLASSGLALAQFGANGAQRPPLSPVCWPNNVA